MEPAVSCPAEQQVLNASSMASAVVLLCVEHWLTTVLSVSTAESVDEGIPDHFIFLGSGGRRQAQTRQQLRLTPRLRAIRAVGMVVFSRVTSIRPSMHLSRQEYARARHQQVQICKSSRTRSMAESGLEGTFTTPFSYLCFKLVTY